MYHTLQLPLSQAEADFIHEQLLCVRRVVGGRIYLRFPTKALHWRAVILLDALRHGPPMPSLYDLKAA